MNSDPAPPRSRGFLVLGGLLLAVAGTAWLALAGQPAPGALPTPRPTGAPITAGVAAAMTNPGLRYSPGWKISDQGADPAEPVEPFAEPAGVVEFSYTGGELAMLLAPGDYWAYLYVTVDGQPANLLPAMVGNLDSLGQPAGYKVLFAPELAAPEAGRWVPIHRSEQPAQPKWVRAEIWRGWGQTPLRGVGVDVLPAAPTPRWPGVLLVAIGVGMAVVGLWPLLRGRATAPPRYRWRRGCRARAESPRLRRVAGGLAALGGAAVAGGMALQVWWLTTAGMLALGVAGLIWPALWLAALLAGLPFYFGVKLPLLPTRSFELIDLGVWGGAVLVAAHWLLAGVPDNLPVRTEAAGRARRSWPQVALLVLVILVAWALVTVFAVRYPDLAFREWRTVFLAAFVFGLTLWGLWRLSPDADRDRRILVGAWLGGATAAAAAGLWGYIDGGSLVTTAEGVLRVQAFYGSPNNLALYLDRTLAVTLALALFLDGGRRRLVWGVAAAVQGLALLLTFSKGSLLMALPAALLVLGVGGWWLLRREVRSPRRLVLLAAIVVIGVALLAPFVGAERFQRLFNLTEGTGFLRLQLWRSAWQMALDHPLLGVGPDQFLYWYRSDYLLPTAWREPNLNHPHNLALDWWTRLGIPGLVLGLAWLGAGIAGIFVWLRRGVQRPLALGLLAASAAALAHGLIDVGYALPDLMIVWVLMFGIPEAERT
jgi:O-antigen ligase